MTLTIPAGAIDEAIELTIEEITAPKTDGTLRPNAIIARAEMAAMLVRVLQLPMKEVQMTAFRDDGAIPDWAKPLAEATARAGLVKGDEQGEFRPAAGMTRAEAIVVILRALDAVKA